jgi:hypothetical protein
MEDRMKLYLSLLVLLFVTNLQAAPCDLIKKKEYPDKYKQCIVYQKNGTLKEWDNCVECLFAPKVTGEFVSENKYPGRKPASLDPADIVED